MNQTAKPTSMIERLDKVESQVKSLNMILKDVPNMIQTVNEQTSQITQNHNNIIKLAQDTSKGLKSHEEFMQTLVNRQISTEQSYAALAKTVNGVVKALTDAGLIKSEDVLTNIRKYDESQEKERIKQMLGFNAITAADVTTEESLVVVEQQFISQDGLSTTIAEYRIVEVSSPLNETKEGDVNQFLGKVVGDVVDTALPDGTLKTKIVEIYAYVQQASAEAAKEEVNG